MALLVLQQPQQVETVSAAANHAVWMLQCAADGLLPTDLLCWPSMHALSACLAACTSALCTGGVLGLFCHRCGACVGDLQQGGVKCTLSVGREGHEVHIRILGFEAM